ncbi:MAG: hypothetical protein VYC34_12735, partial [Planctomycetota bacterium]|nr:hypothetical protein [Planctomycetota bacterium]
MKRRFAVGLLILSAIALAPAAIVPSSTAMAEESATEVKREKDTVYLRNGRVVEGRILSETDTEIRMMVNVAGIEAPTTFKKSDVLDIERGAAIEGAAGAAADDATSKSSMGTVTKETAKSDTAGVYMLELDGMFIGEGGLSGWPQRTILSPKSLRDALKDAKSHNPEVIVIKLDAEAAGGPAGVFVAEYIGPIFEELIYQDGQRVVFWVDQAVGGAGLLPFVCPEIYFTSEGIMGGLSGIGETDTGDSLVDEKLIGAYLGHAEGFAIKGGYDPKLIKAMSRIEEWLAVR